MTKKDFARIALFAVALMVCACDDNNKIGSTVKGTRIAVLEDVKALEADKSLDKLQPNLPHMIVNLSWPQTGYDSVHAIPFSQMAAMPHIIWQSEIGDGSDSDFKLLAQPVVDRGVIYTMDARGLIKALKAKSGQEIWEFDTTPKDSDQQAIGGGVAIDGGIVYATTGFGDVYALKATNGTLKWRKSLLKPLRAAPTVANNKVYVVSIDNDLNALDAASGEILWHHSGITESATLMGAASPAAETDNVVVAYNSGEIFDLRAQNGRVSWNYSLTSAKSVGALPAIADIRGLPVLDGDVVYAISHSGRMAAIDARSGDRVWEADIGGINTPIVAGDTVFVFGGENQLLALSRADGRIMWVKQLAKLVDPDDKDSDRVVWSGPVLAGDRLWLVNSLGHLASFSPKDGATLDTLDLDGPIYVPPVIVDHTMYVLRDDGTLLALR